MNAQAGAPAFDGFDAPGSLYAFDAGAERGRACAPEALAARVAAHLRWRRSLFEWMHASRFAAVPCADRLDDCAPGQTAALADAFLDAISLPMPPLEAFGARGAALALLPPRDCLTVFRLRALVDHADALRAWIDRPRRSVLTDWIGVRGVRVLFERGRELAGAARMHAPQSTLDHADADALAWRGYRLFERECDWPPAGPLALVQLALPANADTSPRPAHDAARGANASANANASVSIVSQLPDLFPELSW